MKKFLLMLTALVAGVTTPCVASAQALASFVIAPASVTGGAVATGTVTLAAVAPTGGVTVTLSSADTTLVFPKTLSIAKGAKTGTVQITTAPTKTQLNDTIKASIGSSQAAAYLTILAPTPTAVKLAATTLIGGASTTGTVTLSGKAPSGGILVTLKPAKADVQVSNVTIAQGATSATFPVTTSLVTAAETVRITATASGATAYADLAVTAVTVKTLTVTSVAVTGGVASAGKIVLNAAAPKTGLIVALTSNNAAAVVPAHVTVAASATYATFTVTTVPVNTNTPVILTAAVNGASSIASLAVNTPAVASIKLSAATVIGSDPVTGTVTLNGKAASRGVLAMLTSSGSSAVVPKTATIAANATTGTFVVSTLPVENEAKPSISATANGGTQSALLTVDPIGLSGVIAIPPAIVGGTAGSVKVTLNHAAPTGGTTVSLKSDNTLVTVPASVVVPAKGTTVTVAIMSRATTSPTTVTITATAGQSILSTKMSVTGQPVVVLAQSGHKFSISNLTVAAGTSIQWRNDDKNSTHTVTSDTNVPGFDSNIASPSGLAYNATFLWTVPAGTPSGTVFYYTCIYHGFAGDGTHLGTGMCGSVTVK